MARAPYLLRLAERLRVGASAWDAERVARHRAFVLSRQKRDGGFAGREEDSDLYYTSFAVRCLGLLGGLSRDEAAPISAYLAGLPLESLNVVDLLSWLATGVAVQLAGGPDPLAGAAPDWIERLALRLESVRTQDGGYAKSPEGAVGSTYQSFLIGLTYQLLGRTVPRPNRLIQFLYDRQRDDGGFVEMGPMKQSGTNPTAAAAALLVELDAMDDEIRGDVRRFLTRVRSSEGGFQANTRIPFADGLSTFTAVLTTLDLDLEDAFDRRQVVDYVTGCLELPTGGFRGASWDEQADVEYTFYSLGALGLAGGA